MSDIPAPPSPFTLVAIHGNGGGAFRFARMRPFIPAEVAFHPVTLPGFARVPRDPGLQSLRDYAAHLRTLVVDLPTPLILLGTGIGGSMALEYAQHYPAAGLILHAPVGTRVDTRLFPRLMKLPGMRALGQWLFAARPFRPLWRRLLFTGPIPDDYAAQFFDEYRHCQVFGQMFDIITADWFAGLRPLPMPAALLWGEKERVLSVDQLEDYKAILPQHVVRTVPAWDHFPMIEQPAAFTREVVALSLQLLAARPAA